MLSQEVSKLEMRIEINPNSLAPQPKTQPSGIPMKPAHKPVATFKTWTPLRAGISNNPSHPWRPFGLVMLGKRVTVCGVQFARNSRWRMRLASEGIFKWEGLGLGVKSTDRGIKGVADDGGGMHGSFYLACKVSLTPQYYKHVLSDYLYICMYRCCLRVSAGPHYHWRRRQSVSALAGLQVTATVLSLQIVCESEEHTVIQTSKQPDTTAWMSTS